MKNAIYACDIGGSKLLCGIVTEEGEIIDTERTPLPPDITTDTLEEYILSFYSILKDRNPEYLLTKCGMTIPGVADMHTGIWVYACFSGIEEYPIARRMEKKLGMPVTIANDVNACALAEKIYGGCGDCDCFMWVTVSNGIGGGIVIDGEIYEGAFGGAAEIGHIVIDPEGLECPCGHIGCMEGMAAGPAISKRYELATGKKCSAKEISDLARQGEPEALEIIHKTGEYIGRALGKAASLLNLEKYILGGGVMQSYDLMEEDIKTAFGKEAFERPNRRAVIEKTALEYEAGLLGAAAIAKTQG